PRQNRGCRSAAVTTATRSAPELKQAETEQRDPRIEPDERASSIDDVPEPPVEAGNQEQPDHQNDRSDRRSASTPVPRLSREERRDHAPAVKARARKQIKQQRAQLEESQQCQGRIQGPVV